jgi:hypothetical protein
VKPVGSVVTLRFDNESPTISLAGGARFGSRFDSKFFMFNQELLGSLQWHSIKIFIVFVGFKDAFVISKSLRHVAP